MDGQPDLTGYFKKSWHLGTSGMSIFMYGLSDGVSNAEPPILSRQILSGAKAGCF